jgi:hypothetical protein
MHLFSFGIASLAAACIIGIGILYLLRPRVMTPNFGLPLPEEGRNTIWWLRLKGVRDIVSGFVMLAVVAWGSPHLLGIILLIQALTPFGDMTLVLLARGSTKTALGVHGVTAALLICGSVPLLLGFA